MHFFFKILSCTTVLENHFDGSSSNRLVMTVALEKDSDLIKIGDESALCSEKKFIKEYGHGSSVRRLDRSNVTLTIREYDSKKIPKKMAGNKIGLIEYGELYLWIDIYYDTKTFDLILNKIEKNIEMQTFIVSLDTQSKNISEEKRDTLILNKIEKDNFVLIQDATFIFTNFFISQN